MGNQSIEDFDKELEFNQVRIRQNSVGFGFFNDLSSGMRLSFDNRFEGNEIQQTIERFITTPAAAAELGAEPYDNKNFIRSTMGFGYRNARGFFPTEGVDFLAEVGHIFHLSDDTTFGDLRTHLSIYQNLNRSKTVVWGSKTMYQTVGAGYEFYQAATLGGRESIRG
ncbi:MAG: hypothetical protein KJP00_13475 [Bacteroidia bacterium]|nr:hypothetical protein [Bacteroidia bacterium]